MRVNKAIFTLFVPIERGITIQKTVWAIFCEI